MKEHPDTLESKYLMTNSGGPESLSFIGPIAYILEFCVVLFRIKFDFFEIYSYNRDRVVHKDQHKREMSCL